MKTLAIEHRWVRVDDELPPRDVVVETKIEDGLGSRMWQRLVLFRGRWFFDDKSMYVYYNPTHWRHCA